MRATEFEAIEKLPPREYPGGKAYLTLPHETSTAHKLPGGSRFLYTIDQGSSGTTIRLWDPQGKDYVGIPNGPKPVKDRGQSSRSFDIKMINWTMNKRKLQMPGQLIGKLGITSSWVPIENAVAVEVITVDEDYRNMGIAKALYGIVLTIMKRPLVAGESQTAGGQRNWVSLASIPGVDMKGWLSIDQSDLDDHENIDIIMGKLGGQYIGKDRSSREYFAFDVRPNTTGKELESHVKTYLSKVYDDYNGDYDSGLYAVWTGQ
jgi:hypothetical protein